MFDEGFRKTEKHIKRTFWFLFVFNTFISVAVLGGLGWLIYTLLKHFGILG